MSSEKEIPVVLQKYLKGTQFLELVNKNILGSLWKVRHPVHGLAALKCFEGTVAKNQKLMTKLFNELEQTKEVHHPNFTTIYQFNPVPHPFILREWVEGRNLDDKIANDNISPVESIQWLIKVALGLQAGYNFDIRHKNLKPSNIIIFEDESTGKSLVKVVDWLLPPTIPHYIAPEMLAEKKSDIRADIYSLGIIFYKTLAGKVPFSGTLAEISRQHQESPYPKIPGLPEEAKEILDKCLAKNADQRYEDFIKLVHALRKARKSLINKGHWKKGEVHESITFSLPSSQEELLAIAQKAMQPKQNKSEQASQELISQVAAEITIELPDVSEPISDVQPSTKNLLREKTMVLMDEPFMQQVKKVQAEEREEFEAQIQVEPIEDDNIPIEPDMENLPSMIPEKVKKLLLMATGIANLKQNNKVLSHLSIVISKKIKEPVIGYLQKVLRRECWIVKEEENSDSTEILIDLEFARTLRYFNFFEDTIQKALMKLPQLSSIQKSVITRIQTLEEDPDFADDTEDTKLSGKRTSKNVGMYSVFDTIIGLHESDGELFAEKEREETEEKTKEETVKAEENREIISDSLDINVNFSNPFQTRAWFKLVKEHGWEQEKHFEIKSRSGKGLKNMCFRIHLLELQDYERKRTGVSNVQEFFQGDYEITRFDHGGMAAVLKLTTKQETLIFLRPENVWAREKLAPYLSVRKGGDGKEVVFATVPKGTEFVVKVAFEGREEALIYEARLLSSLAEDKEISKNIIGMIQQGSFLGTEEKPSNKKGQEERIGYYLMMEYASWGNVEQFSKRFPDNRLPLSVAFNIIYSMVRTLQHLKRKGIIHRDIKPQNILMCSNGAAKLSDFGLAITVEQAGSQLNEERRRLLKLVDAEFLQVSNKKEQAQAKLKKLQEKLHQLDSAPDPQKFEEISIYINEMHKQIDELIVQEKARADGLKEKYRPMSAEEIALKGEFAGSLIYAAPEQFSPSKILTYQCDVYQLGAVSYTIFTGLPPVKGTNITAVMGQIVIGKKPHISSTLPGSPVIDAIGDVIYRMMETDPEKRITIEEVCKKFDEILLEYPSEILAEPTYSRPSHLKTAEEISQWCEKFQYARKVHSIMLPQLRQFLKEAQERSQREEPIEKENQKETLMTIAVFPSAEKPGQFKFRCPGCNRKLQIQANRLGKIFRCPNCQQRILAKKEET